MKRNLYLLYHDKEQIQLNCFISQLYTVLRNNFSIIGTSFKQILAGDYNVPGSNECIFSVLKQRHWRRLIPFLKRYAENSGIIFYDQDPWEAYHDEASSPGVYKLLHSLVPVKRFLVTSGWWAEYIRKTDNLPVSFVRMGVLPGNCDPGPSFFERRYELGFQGTIHPHRAVFFESLKRMGLHVDLLPGKHYDKFLKSVQDIRVFIHDEHSDVLVNGIQSMNGIWIKDLEVAARGCFAIRNTDLDIDSYDIKDVKTIIPFNSIDEIPAILAYINDMGDKDRKRLVEGAVNTIRTRNDWMSVVHSIQQFGYS